MKGEMEMSELRLHLSTGFMKNIITNIITKAIYKKFGYDIDILLKDLVVDTGNGKVHIHINADAELDYDNFKKIVKDTGLL